MMDLTCKEVDFSIEEIEKEILEEERQKKIRGRNKNLFYNERLYQYIKSKRHIARIYT